MNFEIKRDRILMKNETGKIIAEVTFPETSPGVFVIDHTFVDESLRGQGMASKLVQAAVDEIKKHGGQVKATCSYARKWLNEHEV
ncbi:MAG: N-acetyltransferase [Synergistaceae bacterium]|nr:N-acetyltransferase [Synergistaceae bacterium]